MKIQPIFYNFVNATSLNKQKSPFNSIKSTPATDCFVRQTAQPPVSFKANDYFEISDENIEKMQNDVNNTLDSATDENDKPRFSDLEKRFIKANITPQNAKFLPQLVKAEDQNDVTLSALMFVDGAKYQGLNPREQAKNMIDGYNVRPRFEPDEIFLILGAIDKSNEDVVGPLLNVKDQSAEEVISESFKKTKMTNKFMVNMMQQRKNVFLPEDLRTFNRDISPYSGKELATILGSVDENNKDLVVPVAEAKTSYGIHKFNGAETVYLLDTISAKMSKIKDNNKEKTANFIAEIVNNDRFDAPDTIKLIGVYTPNNEEKMKQLIDEKTGLRMPKHFSDEDKEVIDTYLDKKDFENLKKFVDSKKLPSVFANSADDVIFRLITDKD